MKSKLTPWWFQTLLHTPVTLPEMVEYGFAMRPGSENFLSVTPTAIHADEDIWSIPYDKRQCYLVNEKPLTYFKHYTFLNCYMECAANYTFEVSSDFFKKMYSRGIF